MVKFLIPTALRQYTEGKESQVEVKAATVSEALSDLLSKNQKLAKHILDEQGNLRNFVNVFLNDEDIRYLSGENTKVSEKDTIRIVPAIAGGSQDRVESTIKDLDERKITISPREYRR